MNILLVTMALGIGGVETHITELTKELIRRGNNVCVAAADGVYSDALRKAGAELLILPLDSRSPGALAASYRGLKKYISDRKNGENAIDIVHAHARIPCMVCGRLFRRMRGAFHYVTTVHGVYKMMPGAKLLINWGERSLAVSDDAKKYLVDCYGVSPENIDITVNGVDTESFLPVRDAETRREASERFGFSPECRHRIMHVSRIDAASSTAAYQLIEALPHLNGQYPDAEAVIIGGGTEFDALSQKAEEMNKSLGRRAVILLGSRIDVAQLLSCGDYFVGVSRAALEAMSCGLPTVLAGAQGYFGIFDDSEESLKTAQKTNFCFRDLEPSSTEKLTKALSELFGYDSDKLLSLGEYGREIVQKYYSVIRMTDDAEKMYNAVLH